MVKIEVTRQDGTKEIIKAPNAVILYGSSENRNISCYCDKNEDIQLEIAELIVDAKALFVENGTPGQSVKRMATIGLVDLMMGRRYNDMLKEKAEKIQANKRTPFPFPNMNL